MHRSRPSRPFPASIALAGLAGLLTTCRGAAPDPRSRALPEITESTGRQEIRTVVDPDLDVPVLEIHVPDQQARFGIPDAARCSGVVLDDGNRRQVLRFAEVVPHAGRREHSPRNRPGLGPPPNTLRLSTSGDSGHEISVEVTPDPAGGFQVEVRDRIALRRTVAGLELIWEFPERLSRCEVLAPDPEPTPGSEELTGLDETFRLGAALVRSGPSALVVRSDLDLLAQDRRLPWVLQVVGAGRSTHVVHGLRTVGEPVSLRDEELRFAQHVRFVADADSRLRSETVDAIWNAHASARMQRSPAPLDGSRNLDELADEILARLLRRPTIHLDRRARRIEVAPDATDDGSTRIVLGLGGQFLLDAEALARAGRRKNDPALLRRARDAAEFALAAKWRSGLAPYGWSRRKGWEHWEESDPHGSSPSAYRVADSAWILLRLASLAEVLPEIRQRVDARADDLAGFLRQNQLEDGAIPAYYESTWLAPDGDRWTSAAHHAFLCWFLADHLQRRRPDDRALHRVLRRAFRRIHASIDGLQAMAFETEPNEGRGSALVLAAACRAAVLWSGIQPGPDALPTEDDADPAPDGEDLVAAARHDLVAACSDALAELQSCWRPPWREDGVLGGFAHDDGSRTWNSDATPHAAAAMLEAWRVLGDRVRLERSAAGLRAGLLCSSPGAGLAVVERIHADLGHAVAEISEGYAATFTTAWFEEAAPQVGGRIALAPTTWPGGPPELRVRLVDRSGATPIGASVGDRRFDPESRSGEPVVVLPTHTVPRVRFAPPGSLPAETPWKPRARCDGDLDAARFTARITDPDGGEHSIPLERVPGKPGLLIAESPFLPRAAWRGRVLRCDLVCEFEGRRSVHPPDATREIGIGRFHRVDFGDSLELEVYSEPTVHGVVRFPTGRENARRLDPAVPLRVTLAIPAESPSVDLRLLVSGEPRVTVDDHGILEVGPTWAGTARHIDLQLADPRLWRNDPLDLEITCAPGAGESTIAWLDWRSAIPLELQPSLPLAAVTTEPPIESRLDVLVIPLCRPEPALWIESEPLRRAFFAGPEYRLAQTGSGEALTTGSAREWLKVLSGGLTTLEGEVLDRVEAPPEAFRTPADRLAAALPTLRRAIARRTKIPDLVFLVTPSNELPEDLHTIFRTTTELHPRTEGNLPVVVLEIPAGAVPACGDLVEAVLDARGVLDDYATPSRGNLGDLALTSAPRHRHQPPAPAGPNLARAGWIDVLSADPDAPQSGRVVLAPSVKGRVALECPDLGLPRRERFWVEARGGIPAEGRLASHRGLLLLRRFAPRSRPTFLGPEGRSVRPDLVRIPAAGPLVAAPFRSGTAADLIGSASRLDGRSSPSIANVEGEVGWTFRDIRVRDDGICELTPIWQGVELLKADRRPNVTCRVADGDSTPLPLDGVDRSGLGTSSFDNGVLRLAPRGPGTVFRVDLPRPAGRGPERAFLALQVAAAPARVRISAGGVPLLETTLEPGARWAECVLPPSDSAASLALRVEPVDAATVVAIGRAATVPIEVPRTPIHELDTVSAFLFDGTWTRAAALPADGRRIDVPVLLPQGNSALTLRAALPAGATDPIRLFATLREFEANASTRILDGLAITPDADGALLRLRAPLPARAEDRAAILELWAEGAEGAVLAVPDLSIAR